MYQTLSAVLLGMFPAVFWLIFFLFEDRKDPEPRSLIAGIFLAGSLSALTAAVLQLLIQNSVFPLLFIQELSIAYLLVFAFIEELVKFFAAYIVIYNNRSFDEPVDGMIYMITSAMGFAALENIVFLMSPNGTQFETMIFRFVGATLLHALASGLVGYYWVKRKSIVGLLIGTLLHLTFNVLILTFYSTPFYACTILIFASFFLFYDFDILKAYGRKESCN